MPSNENEYNGRVTRSRSRGAPVTESAASVATPAAKPQRKAATNASSTTKGRGGGKKSSSTARSTPAAEDATVVADDGSLILTPDDFISLSKDKQKRKIQAIFTDLGIQDITEGIPSSKANNLRACLPLSQADFQKFLKQWVPGYTEKSNDILTMADHLRKAVFPAPSLALIPAGKKDANTKDDVSLRAAYLHICGVPPQSSNGWSQNILMKGIQKQLDSEIDGGDYHYTQLTNNELIDKIQHHDGNGKKITYKKRWKLVKESWKRDHPGSDFDYTTSTANASHGRSVPVIATGTPADAAPSLSGGSTDANVPRSSDTVAVVPPTPTPRNPRNGNGVAPPVDNNNTPHPSESQAVAAPSETNLILRTLQSTSDRRDRELNGMWGQMNVQNNNIAKAFDEMTDLRKVSNTLQHDVSGLQAGQQRLEGEFFGLQTDVSGLKTRVGNLENTFEDTVKEFVKEEIAKSTRKKRHSKRVEVEDVDNDEFARLTRNASFSPTPSHTAQVAAASVDGSNDSFDEGEVGQTSVASRLVPDDAAAAPVHADNYRVFLRRLKDAMLHGQGGREVEMNACLKEAEHIMLNTELNEEWNTWHDNFNKKSECARKLFSQYGLKPAAR